MPNTDRYILNPAAYEVHKKSRGAKEVFRNANFSLWTADYVGEGDEDYSYVGSTL